MTNRDSDTLRAAMAISAGIAAIASATAAANGYTLAAIAAGAFMIVAGVGVAFMVRQNPPG
jgi:hypothetical protein